MNNIMKENLEIMTYEEIWKEKSLNKTSSGKINTIVCFLSDSKEQQITGEVINILNDATQVIFIAQGTSYKKLSQELYNISYDDPETYNEALGSIQKDYEQVDAILYMWPLEDRSLNKKYSAIIYILKAISVSNLKSKRLLLTAQYINELERCYLESWIGFERSLGMILPNTKVAVIFREVNEEYDMKKWIMMLWEELIGENFISVHYCNNKRYICKIQPTSIKEGCRTFITGKTYLITGGCGGLGFIFAEHFAKMNSVNLILTGRSDIDKEKQLKIKRLIELGSQVLYIKADVSNLVEMEKGLRQAKKRFGEIHGVIHAAGINNNQSILTSSIKSFEEVLEPKIKGTIVLEELLKDESVEFICYYSSSSAILGDFGSCDYAIGNRFQVAYTHYQNKIRQQCRSIVVNWPLWKDGGMKLKDEESTKIYLRFSGQRLLENDEGIKIFKQILSQDKAQHMVLVGKRNQINRFLGLS